MRKLLILFLSAFAVQSNAQVAFELIEMNVVYIGLPNPFNLVVQGVAREDLRFATGNCQVLDSAGQFYLKCKHRGDAAVWILNQKGDTLDKKTFRVRSIPKPEVRFGTLKSGKHSAGAIRAQPGIFATLGEGFAYGGVRYTVDSAVVRIETLQGTWVCHQKGKTLDGRLNEALNQDLVRIYIEDIYVSRPGSSDPVLLQPIEIIDQEFSIHPTFYPQDWPPIPKPVLQACSFRLYDSVTYTKGGDNYMIRKQLSETWGGIKFLHFKNGDTLIHIDETSFRSFYPGNVLKESGEIRVLNDSLFGVSIQGKFNKSWYRRGMEPGFYEIDSEIDRRTYPVGEWKYYHPNGKLKAQGNYKIHKVTREWDNLHETPNTLLIYRTGTWKFYDEEGNLVEKVKYK